LILAFFDVVSVHFVIRLYCCKYSYALLSNVAVFCTEVQFSAIKCHDNIALLNKCNSQ